MRSRKRKSQNKTVVVVFLLRMHNHRFPSHLFSSDMDMSEVRNRNGYLRLQNMLILLKIGRREMKLTSWEYNYQDKKIPKIVRLLG
jgi:hypothetical protein